MSNDSDTLRTLPEQAFRARAGLVAGVFCLICLGLAVRLLFLQVVGGGWYAQRALGQQLRDTVVPADRGRITSGMNCSNIITMRFFGLTEITIIMMASPLKWKLVRFPETSLAVWVM